MPYKDKEKGLEHSRKYAKAHRKERNELNRKYRQRHLEEGKEYRKVRYQEKKVQGRADYQEHREEHKVYSKKWHQKYKEEHNEQKRKYMQEHKEEMKESHYRRTYGLSLQDIDEILIKQEHKCAICGKSLIETRRCIDHDHGTGKVRGILCVRCNSGLWSIEDGGYFNKAIEYLNSCNTAAETVVKDNI